MDLKDVVSIAGIGGLHKIVGQRPTGLIVETLDEQKKRFPTNLTQKISVLDDISIYTLEGEARLREVMLSIREKEEGGAKVPGKKDSDNDIRAFVETVLPNYDKERVYISDLKKLVVWYSTLKSLLDWDAMKGGDDEGEKEAGKDEKKEALKKTAAKTPKGGAPAKTVTPKSANVKMKSNTPRKTGGA